MAHELDMTTGKAAIAYAQGGERPWHGYGHVMKPGASIEEWAKACGFEWSAIVEKMGSFNETTKQWEEVENGLVVRRSDNRAKLGTFTEEWVPTQPIDILRFFQNFLLVDPRFTIETAGALRGGKVIWALAKFCDELVVNKDRHACYVLITTSFDGSLLTTIQGTVIRVVCQNTLSASLYRDTTARVAFAHTRKFEGAVAEEAANKLTGVIQGFGKFESMAKALADIKLGRDSVHELFDSLILSKTFDEGGKQTEGSKRATAKTMAQFYALRDKAVREGCEANSGWNILQAITDYGDHHIGYRAGLEDPRDARMYSAFFGRGNQVKAKGVGKLLELID